jgi:dTDP-L-rhamnose 4-epimerase
MKVLVTGGSGFIGKHLCRKLLNAGFSVTNIDRVALGYQKGAYKEIRFDITQNLDLVLNEDYDYIVHLAAEVGSGLSTIEPVRFCLSNTVGTANIFEWIKRNKKNPKNVIVASSATVYGESTYVCQEHGIFYPELRSFAQLAKSEWEIKCPNCGLSSKATAINENRLLKPASVYGQSKLDTELLALNLGRSYGIPVVAFRPFGVFGPEQSLGNPYTGVMAMFSSLLMAGLDVKYYEDGMQNKSYIYIDDAIDLFMIAIEKNISTYLPINMGTDDPHTIIEIANYLKRQTNTSGNIYTLGEYRLSDTRHMWADITLAREIFGWSPKVNFQLGVNKFLEWIATLPKEVHSESVNRFKSAEKRAIEAGLPL